MNEKTETTAAEDGEGAKSDALQLWLVRANDAYTISTDFTDNNYRKMWEDNIRMFQSRHPVGSKYNSPNYRYRSKLFRPKTRSASFASEAAAAAAFFENEEAVSIEPFDSTDKMMTAGAELRDAMLNYRLGNTMNWFQTCIGAFQEGRNYGVIASRQYWDYEYYETEMDVKGPNEEAVIENETGERAKDTVKKVLRDTPKIELIPIENIKFHPDAGWIRPHETSPFLIVDIPMQILDVKERIEDGKWNSVSDEILRTARNSRYNSLANERDNNSESKTDPRFTAALSDFDTVWVREVTMRIRGTDYHYFTLSDVALLTDPRPIWEVYKHGRNVVIGTSVIEAHRNIPDSPVHLGKDLQKMGNEVANSRLDNVRLAINKRYKVKRGAQVDIKSLVRNAAASVTLVNSMDDVGEMEFNDVTGSSYAEQDRINADYDDLLGNFSSGSVQTNRKMNETVGGMAMMRSSSGSITQYMIRIFTETWVEPVLRMVDEMEQHYETDIRLLQMLSNRLGLDTRYGIKKPNRELFLSPCTVKVNVSNSATDPIVRLDQFVTAMAQYGKMVTMLPREIDRTQVFREIMGRLGYKDGSRFIISNENADPQVLQLQSQVDQLMQMIQAEQVKADARMKEIELKEQGENDRTDKKLKTEILKTLIKEDNPQEEVSQLDNLQEQILELSQKIAISSARTMPMPGPAVSPPAPSEAPGTGMTMPTDNSGVQ